MKRDVGEPADCQGSSPPSSRTVHPVEQEIEQRQSEAYGDGQGAPVKCKKEAYKRWKQGRVTWEEYRSTV